MTSTDALATVVRLSRQISEGVDEHAARQVALELDEWTLSPLLAPVAALIARAWLEQSPASAQARMALVSSLLACGREAEARDIEGGAMPTLLLEDSEEDRLHLESVVAAAQRRLDSDD
jgi:hypothetical protein